jgi:hypothetical protein
MAGSCTITQKKHGSVKYVNWAWTSDSDGDMDQGATTFDIDGEVLKVITVPDGSAAPSANYDLVINDDLSVDIASGLLANRHTSNTEEVLLTTIGGTDTTAFRGARPVSGVLDLVVSNAGNAKQGQVRLYYR